MNIPNKSTFKLDEVCKITGVRPYILRFWESEFSQISPLTTASGHRVYERKDIEVISQIKGLLFDENFTVERAKEYLTIGDRPVIQDSNDVQDENLSEFPLSDRDTQKLVLAKAKLQSVISRCEDLKRRLNLL